MSHPSQRRGVEPRSPGGRAAREAAQESLSSRPAGTFLADPDLARDQPERHQAGDGQQPPILDMRLLIAEDEQDEPDHAEPQQDAGTAPVSYTHLRAHE